MTPITHYKQYLRRRSIHAPIEIVRTVHRPGDRIVTSTGVVVKGVG